LHKIFIIVLVVEIEES